MKLKIKTTKGKNPQKHWHLVGDNGEKVCYGFGLNTVEIAKDSIEIVADFFKNHYDKTKIEVE